MRRTLLFTILPLLLTPPCLLACGGEDDLPPAPAAIRSTGPQIGKADSMDKADHSCKVVLRSIGRTPGGSDYQTQCKNGVCNYIWSAVVEADKAQTDVTAHILYRMKGDTAFWQADGTLASTSQPGYQAYTFSLSEHLFGPSLSAAKQATAQIELIPYLKLADGSRLFDHNVKTGDNENYLLSQSNGFAATDEGKCAPVMGRISFLSNWDEVQTGTLRQGGYLVIDYDINRLTTCRGTHNGFPAWDIVAYVKWQPAGTLVQGSVRSLVTNNGTPTNVGKSQSLVLQIPQGATKAEIWFQNYTGAGSSCSAWDSNQGQNYSFSILPAASSSACQDIELYNDKYGGKPYCLDYTISAHYNASYCEFYLSGIGDGYEGHYGIPFNWVEAYLRVKPQQGTLLGAGMLTQYRDKDGTLKSRYSFAKQKDADTWMTGFTYVYTGVMGTGSYTYKVEKLAFFIDVKRTDGKVVRLWQSKGGANYTWSDAFGAGTTTVSIPYGSVKYAVDQANIFDIRRTCQ